MVEVEAGQCSMKVGIHPITDMACKPTPPLHCTQQGDQVSQPYYINATQARNA